MQQAEFATAVRDIKECLQVMKSARHVRAKPRGDHSVSLFSKPTVHPCPLRWGDCGLLTGTPHTTMSPRKRNTVTKGPKQKLKSFFSSESLNVSETFWFFRETGEEARTHTRTHILPPTPVWRREFWVCGGRREEGQFSHPTSKQV